MSIAKTGTWTRRQFTQAAAATAAGLTLPRWTRGTSLPRAEGLVFAGVVSNEHDGAIHTLRVRDGQLTPITVTPSMAPGKLLMHPSLPVLYALHDVALWDYLPRGAVSAYRFDTRVGALTLLGTQPLSLAASHPRDGVIFSQATALFVTTGAGIYNALLLGSDGSLMPVSAIRKVLGTNDAMVRLHGDGETLLVGTSKKNDAFRLVQHEHALTIQQVEAVGIRLPHTDTLATEVLTTKLRSRVSGSVHGVRSIAFRDV